MQTIDQAQLQNLYIQKALGVDYINSLKNLQLNTKKSLPDTFDRLSDMVSNCTICPLAKSSKNRVFGVGSTTPKVMFVGYSHSKHEDEINQPLIGKSKQMIDDIITNVLNLEQKDIYMTNIFKCQVGANEEITEYELQSCKPYLLKQIEILKPKIIVALGENSYNSITGESLSLEKLRGHVIEYDKYKIVATYHPNFLLRNPSLKKDALSDFKLVKEFI